MAGDECYLSGMVTVGQGNARICGCADGGGDSRNHLEGHAGGNEYFGLLASAPEDKRVPAFESGHGQALAGLFHDQGVDAFLGKGMVAAFLADVNHLRVRIGVSKQGRRGQIIVDHHIGSGDAVDPLDRYQAGISGTGPHQIDASCRISCVHRH